MSGPAEDARYQSERRRRLAAERTLERTRTELSRAHRALVANADRLSLRYLSEREANLRLTDRQKAVLAQRKAEAEKADRARRRLWHALEAMRDGFAVFDDGSRLVAANSVFLGLFDAGSAIGPGASAEELFRVAAEEGAFVVEEAPEAWVSAQLARWQGEEIAPQTLETFDGRTVRLQARRAPDGDLVCLAVDVTADRARERDLAEARDAAEDTVRAKQDFLARMSHEIRTPMNGVLGLSEMLAERELDPESRGFARTIRDSAEALLTIVDDTLDISRLNGGQLDLREEPFDLEAALIDCVRLAGAGRSDGVPIAFDFPLDAPVTAIGDAGRIRQVAMNLIGNAIKFTREGHVLVRVRLVGEGDNWQLVLEVHDTGPGIPEDQRGAVFDAFAQVPGNARHGEGTGLGLTISRGLVERMGGTLVLASGEGPGSRFVVTMPLKMIGAPIGLRARDVLVPRGGGVQADVLAARLEAAGMRVLRGGARAEVAVLTGPAEIPDGLPVIAIGSDLPDDLTARAMGILELPVASAALRRALASAAGGSLRVLVADDNATNRFLLDRMLSQEGYVLDVVEDGDAAVAAFAAHRPDMVLMDISMPGMDGFEALAAIRHLEAGAPPVPVIALTAHAGPEIEARLAAAGFAARHAKPVRRAALIDAMEGAMRG